MSPFDNEQSDLIHRVYMDPALEKLPMMKDLLKLFTTAELMRWTKIEEIYGPTLKALNIFDPKTETGQKRYKTLHQRIVEHVLASNLEHPSYQQILLKDHNEETDCPA
jgi:26S proteasome regulatory subunit N5